MGSVPRWSVVIPVHNCAGYLAEALPEVLAQLAGSDAEIIVVDDASTDDPAGVVERLGGGRVAYRPNPGHLGAIGTFNRCLELASGELLQLLHGDDLVRPGFYAAMAAALDDHPTAVAAVCRVEDVDAAGSPTYVTRSYRTGTGIWENALEALAVSNRVRAPGIVVRRRAYAEAGGYRTDLPHAADWEMWTRLAAHGPVVFVDRVLARYRRHPGSDTSTRVRSGENLRERVTAIGVITEHIPARRRPLVSRRALAYATIFAARTTWTSIRHGDWPAAGAQLRQTLRCIALLPLGIRRVRPHAV